MNRRNDILARGGRPVDRRVFSGRRGRRRCLFLSLLLLIGLAPVGVAQAQSAPTSVSGGESRPTLQAHRLQGPPPVVDGRLDEEVWSRAQVAEGFVQFRPTPGAPATHPTEARVLYDDEAIYVAIRAWDPEPSALIAPLARRGFLGVTDRVGVIIDSYHDRRTAFHFAVTPRGVKSDGLHFDDNRRDANWDAVWDVATTVDEEWWTAEFRIPLSQLRFSSGTGEGAGAELSWGINFDRVIARYGEESHWAPIPANRSTFVSSAGELTGLRDLRRPRGIEFLPYVTGQVARVPGDPSDPFFRANAGAWDVGLDLKASAFSKLTFTATVNPDFGQVEADPDEVNLSAFELFHPERRPFFTEGAEIFRHDLGFGGEHLFYSRRIGRTPQRRPQVQDGWLEEPRVVPILAAAKLSGRTDRGWTVGLSSAFTPEVRARARNTDGEDWREPLEPASSYTAIRLARDFRQGRSALGGTFTAVRRDVADDSPLDFLHREAYAGGVNARHRFGPGNGLEVSGALLGSHVAGSDAALRRTQSAPGRYLQRPDAEHLRFDPERTSLSGFDASLQVRRVGGGAWTWTVRGFARSAGFEVNDLGFQRQSDVLAQHSMVRYERHPGDGPIRQWWLATSQSTFWTFGGERTQASGQVTGNLLFSNQWGLTSGMGGELSQIAPHALRGGPALLAPGTRFGFVNFHSDRRRRIFADLMIGGNRWNEMEGGSGMLGSSLTARPSGRLQASLAGNVQRDERPTQWVTRVQVDGDPVYVLGHLSVRTSSVTARLDFTLTPNLSLQFSARPYSSNASISDFMEVVNPRTRRAEERFDRYGEDRISEESVDGRTRFLVDRNGDGNTDFTFWDPSFTHRSLQANTVVRWEYRPGSTLFLVWGNQRDVAGSGWLNGEGESVFQVKASHWFGR